MLIGGSFSYLYFRKQGENTNVVKSGCLKISLSESSGLILENEVPVIDKVGREKTPYTVTLTNICNTDAYFKTTLNVLDSSNTDNISKTKLAVSGDRTINSLLVSELMKAKLSNTPSNVVDTYLIDRGYIGVGESITYDIRLWIDYEATSYEGSLDTKVIVDSYVKGQEPIYLKSNLASSWKDKVDNELNYLALYTLNTKELPSTYTYNNETYTLTNTIDVSEQKNSEVLLGEYTNSDKIIALIGQEEGVIAPLNSSHLFSANQNKDGNKFKIIDLHNLDTSKSNNLTSLFQYCTSLTSLNLGNFNTKNNTSLKNFVYYCNKLKEINMDNFDTSNVVNMEQIFAGCTSLLEINLSNFNTKKVEYFDWAFFYCTSLTTLDLSNIDTTSAIRIEGMFSYCNLLENIDLSNFNTSNAKYMNALFYNCINLKNINLTSFNTSNVTTMKEMFNNCLVLSKVEVGCDWIINENVDTTNMFSGCKISEVVKVC